MASILRLTPEESARLTKMALAFSIGRGTMGKVSRTYVLKINHPAHRETIANYQWERLRTLIPAIKPYRWSPGYGEQSKQGAGNWQVRVSCRYLETAWRLLYGSGSYRVDETILSLLGAEAMATLWADRAELLPAPNRKGVLARIHMIRYDQQSAAAVLEWIFRLTGAEGEIGRMSWNPDTPILKFKKMAVIQILEALQNTWHANNITLKTLFDTPLELRTQISERLRQRRIDAGDEAPVVPTRSRRPARAALRIEDEDGPITPPPMRPPSLAVPDLRRPA